GGLGQRGPAGNLRRFEYPGATGRRPNLRMVGTMNQPTVLTLRRRLIRAGVMLGLVLAASVLLASAVGYQTIDWRSLWHDETLRSVFLQLRFPRVVMAGLIGSTLALVGAALQALFRNPLADPFVLGVSGGGAFGASIAITFGWGTQISGLPIVFLTAFAGAGVAVLSAYRITRGSGPFGLPSALLLAGVVINLIANAGVITIQCLTDYTRALQILRWLIGSLDVVGFDLIGRMLIFLIPSWIVLLAFSNDLQLFAVDEETAVSLGVDVRRLQL